MDTWHKSIIVASESRTLISCQRSASTAGLFPLASEDAVDRHGLGRPLHCKLPDASVSFGARQRLFGIHFPVSSKTPYQIVLNNSATNARACSVFVPLVISLEKDFFLRGSLEKDKQRGKNRSFKGRHAMHVARAHGERGRHGMR